MQRTREAEELNTPGTSRVTKLKTGPKVKRPEGGRQWTVCEGFQFILRSQAEALVKLGVDERFKDKVLVHLWRLYLQKSQQAYMDTPVHSATFRLVRSAGAGMDTDLTSGSALGSESGLDSQHSGYDSDRGSRAGYTVGSMAESGLSDWSLGSLDSMSYVFARRKRRSRPGLMSMRKTLALLYVALTWSRQSLSLCQLLRLVEHGHVPYVNSYECFPEEMKLSNSDAMIFKVQSIPSYLSIHQESQSLIKFLRLPTFPPISLKSSLHPLNISLRLLIELNLPDEMAKWVEAILHHCDLMDSAHVTFDPLVLPKLPHYDLFAAAAIIIAMKQLFGFDDSLEWELSSCIFPDESDVFSVRKWYRLLQQTLLRHKRRALRQRARRRWIPKKPFYFTQRAKAKNMKRRYISDQLTSCFKRLSDRHGDAQGGAVFCLMWGRDPDADGRSMHHLKLNGGARTQGCFLDDRYWHLIGYRSSLDSSVPQSFLWLLGLISFVLNVETDLLFKTVVNLERKLLRLRYKPNRQKKTPNPQKPPRSESRSRPTPEPRPAQSSSSSSD